MPKFCSPLLLDKYQYHGLEFFLYPLLYPNKETESMKRVKLFFGLMLLVTEYLMFLFTVTAVWNTGETGNILHFWFKSHHIAPPLSQNKSKKKQWTIINFYLFLKTDDECLCKSNLLLLFLLMRICICTYRYNERMYIMECCDTHLEGH